jgi:hypothetical protein
MFWPIDHMIGPKFTTAQVDQKLGEYEKLRNLESIKAILPEFASLDAKSSSLLQHLSIMIASLSVSYAAVPKADGIIVDILILNILCSRRCLDHTAGYCHRGLIRN